MWQLARTTERNIAPTFCALACAVAAALGASAATTPGAAQPAPARSAHAAGREDDAPAWADFTRAFDAAVDSGRVVGAAAVLVRDGRVVARHARGLADRTRAQPVTDRTLFHYGSITKTLTAVAVLQLRDAGRLSLDDPVTRYVPELRRVHDPYGMIDSVTLRMLLSHSAGFQDPTWPYGKGRDWEPFEPTEWAQLVAMMPYQQLEFRPGSRFGYSNPGYVYLAQVVERLSGEPWAAYVQKRVLAPLGLTRSYFGLTPPYLAADRSNNYTVRADSAGAAVVRENGREFDPGVTIPNGGWNAPLDDAAGWAGFLAGAPPGDTAAARRYDAVLRRATLEEMWRPVVAAGREMSVGLGFFVVAPAGRGPRLVGHTGSQAGFLAFLWCNPSTRTAVITALNTADERPRAASPLGIMQRAALPLLR